MAAFGIHIESPTAEYSDCIFVPKIILPDGTEFEKWAFLLDNFVYDEIERLVEKYKLPGTHEDYNMQIVKRNGKSITLHRKEAVETYDEDLRQASAVKLVARRRYQHAAARSTAGNSGDGQMKPNNDSIFVNKIVLPEGKIVTNRDFLWDNTIKDEIDLLGQVYDLPLGVQDYEMQLDNGECTLVLDREKVVEDYIEHMFEKEFTITLIESKDLPPPEIVSRRVKTDQDSEDWESYLLTELHLPNGKVLHKGYWVLWVNAVEDEIYSLIYLHNLPGTTVDYEMHMIRGTTTTVMEPNRVVEDYDTELREKDCIVKLVPKSTLKPMAPSVQHGDESASSSEADSKKGLHSDFIIVPRVTLPNSSTVIDYSLGWNNTIEQEISSLVKDNGLEGSAMDFELELSSKVEKICLDRKKCVSFYHTQLNLEDSHLSLVGVQAGPPTHVDQSPSTFDGLNIFLPIHLPDGKTLPRYALCCLNSVEDEIENYVLKGLLTGKPNDYVMLHINGETTTVLDSNQEVEVYSEQLQEGGIIKVLHKSDAPS